MERTHYDNRPDISLGDATKMAIAIMIYDKGWRDAYERLKLLNEYFVDLPEWPSIYTECRTMIYEAQDAEQRQVEAKKRRKRRQPPQ